MYCYISGMTPMAISMTTRREYSVCSRASIDIMGFSYNALSWVCSSLSKCETVPPIRSRDLKSSPTKLSFESGRNRYVHGKSSAFRGKALYTQTIRLTRESKGVRPGGLTAFRNPGKFVDTMCYRNPKNFYLGATEDRVGFD